MSYVRITLPYSLDLDFYFYHHPTEGNLEFPAGYLNLTGIRHPI